MHVNWGWYGIENGFFDIALLNPVQYTYDDWQAMYVGLYPNQELIAGEVNGDGEVDVRDITELIDIIMNSGANPRADINNDTEIDVRDITALIDIIMNS